MTDDPARPSTLARRFTPRVQAAFLGELARSGVVRWAAAAAEVDPRDAYRFRLDPDGEVFRRGWSAAQATLRQTLIELALVRIVEGTPTDIVRNGVVVGQKRVYSDRLLTFLITELGGKPAAPTRTAPTRTAPTRGGTAARGGAAARGTAPAAAPAADPAADPADVLTATLVALDDAAATGAVPVLPPIPVTGPALAEPIAGPIDVEPEPDAEPPYDAAEAHAERVVRAELRIADYREQEADRARCAEHGIDWVPRPFKPLPELKHKTYPGQHDVEPEVLYHRLKRTIAGWTERAREAAHADAAHGADAAHADAAHADAAHGADAADAAHAMVPDADARPCATV